MANRNNVYIGNRYVPIFADPVEWDNLRIYEPLTIVTYQGTSYTSKKTVPVGIALSNTEYWVATGNYNAQVAQYAEEVATYKEAVDTLSDTTIPGIENEISALDTRIDNLESPDDIYIMISDSYGGTFGNGSGDSTTFLALVREKLGRTSDNFITRAWDGEGFCKAYQSNTFVTQMATLIASLTPEQKAKVTKVFVVAGRNDYEYTIAQIKTAITSFVEICKESLPKCEVTLMFVGNGSGIGNGTKAQQKNVFIAYQECVDCGATYLAGGEAILRNSDLMAADTIHPNATGKQYLAKYVTEAVLNGYCSVNYAMKTTTVARVPSGITTNISFRSVLSNNIVTLLLSSLGSINFSSARTAGTSTDIVVGYIDTNKNFYCPVQSTPVPCVLDFWNGSTHQNIAGALYIDNDNSIHLKAYAASNTSFDTVVVTSSGTTTFEAIDM